MPKKTEIKSVFESKNIGDNISINGWVKTFRSTINMVKFQIKS